MFEDALHLHARNLIALAIAGWSAPTLRHIASAPDPLPPPGGGNPPAPPAPPDPGPAPTPPAPPAPPPIDNATIRAMRAELDKRGNENATFKAQLEKLAKENEDLKHQQELAGKTVEERARIETERLQRQHAQLLKERSDELEKTRAAEAEARRELDTYVVTTRVQSAVAKAKVLQGAQEHAALLFQLEAKVRTEAAIESGKPKRIVATIDGNDYVDDMDKAFAAWLAKQPHLQAHPGGGAGTPYPTGGGSMPLNTDSMSASDLIAAGLAAKKKR